MIGLGIGLNWFGGGIIGQIGKELNKAYQAKLQSKNNSERIEADKQIEFWEARRSILVAESAHKNAVIMRAVMRAVLATPVAVVMWKLFVWDKVLGWGATDSLSPELWNFIWIVTGFYFVYETAGLFKRS